MPTSKTGQIQADDGENPKVWPFLSSSISKGGQE
jgi:hypothetical protein